MNKVFETTMVETKALEPVEVAVHEPVVAQPPAPQPQQHPSQPARAHNSVLTVVAVAGIVSSGWLLSQWQSSRDQLAQERSLLMLERLRTSAPSQPAEASTNLAPPAPEPAWMNELQPLTLQETQRPAIASQTPMPTLTGVVQSPGGNSAALFQLGGSSLSASLGEAIGSSGWVLESVSESGAVIRRNGQRHNLAVGGVL